MHRYLDLGQKANVISGSPQWGSNSKGAMLAFGEVDSPFSPRNGEVILKPMWNSKGLWQRLSVPAMGK